MRRRECLWAVNLSISNEIVNWDVFKEEMALPYHERIKNCGMVY